MTYRGHVKNGVVVFDEPNLALPEGSIVDISPLPNKPLRENSEELPSLFEILEPYIGIVDDLPQDMSINHDHYLYGTPKIKP